MMFVLWILFSLRNQWMDCYKTNMGSSMGAVQNVNYFLVSLTSISKSQLHWHNIVESKSKLDQVYIIVPEFVWIPTPVNFSLTNNVVSFEQLAPIDRCENKVNAFVEPKTRVKICLDYVRPRGQKTFSMFNSFEHETLNAHKYKSIK